MDFRAATCKTFRYLPGIIPVEKLIKSACFNQATGFWFRREMSESGLAQLNWVARTYRASMEPASIHSQSTLPNIIWTTSARGK